MQTPQLIETYDSLLKQGDVDTYLRRLAQDGLSWWFNMDILQIALHLQALQSAPAEDDPATPARLTFLAGVSAGDISATAMSALYQRFLDEDDWEAAAAAAGAGCGAVWDSGYDFRRFQLWLERIDFLLANAAQLSPLARASVLGFKCNAEMNGRGDLAAAATTCHRQILAAEEAHSIPLRIFHAALQTYCHLWNGNLAGAGVLLQDAEFLCAHSAAPPAALALLHSSSGLFHTLNGDPETGRKILEETVAQPLFDRLPPSVWLLVQSNLLFAIAHCEDSVALEAVAEKIRGQVIPRQNAFHHSYAHFSLGVAALGLGEPHKALAHAEQAIERGMAAYSAVIERMPVLLKGQALADLGRDEEALALFEAWMGPWQACRYCTVAATAAQEAAWIRLRQEQPEQARAWYERAVSSMPAGERLPLFHRPPRYRDDLQAALFRQPVTHAPRAPVRICCFGGLRIEIGDRVIYDRKWRGGRTKALLKALIVQGGRKVSMEQLADTLWPDSEGDQAYRNLKVLVWRLRHLGLDKGQEPLPWLQLQHGHLSLVEKYCSVDVFRFETNIRKAVRADRIDWELLKCSLDRYTGDFLASDVSETWIIEHRERLRRRYLEGVLVLAATAKDLPARQACQAYLQRALDIDPLDERIYEHLMQTYLLLGYPAKALETYHDAQTALERELAISPGSTLVALARQAAGDA